MLSILVFSPDGMHQTLHCGIQCIGAVHFHHCLILWIFRCTWKQPHCLITPVIEWMESRRCSVQKVESNSRIRYNSPAHTIFRLVSMRLIKNPKTPWTVWQLAIAWWFRSRCWCIIWHKVDIPSVLRLVDAGVQILVGEIRIFGVQQVDEFEIGSMCHHVNDSLESFCHSGHCDYQDWFMGQYKCGMPVWSCCLYLQQVAGHQIQSLEQIPLPFFTNNARKVIVRQNHPLFQGIPP